MHTQDIEPPPPEYTETLPIPEPEQPLPQQPTPAQPQYLPQQSPYNPDNLTPQQRNARIGQEYRDGLLAKCANGQHDETTSYGVCGIISAILCFPIGLLFLFMDTNKVCSRCGIQLSQGSDM